MHILLKATPVKNRELVTYVNRLHRSMEASARFMGTNSGILYSFQAASFISNLLQPQDDSFQKY